VTRKTPCGLYTQHSRQQSVHHVQEQPALQIAIGCIGNLVAVYLPKLYFVRGERESFVAKNIDLQNVTSRARRDDK